MLSAWRDPVPAGPTPRVARCMCTHHAAAHALRAHVCVCFMISTQHLAVRQGTFSEIYAAEDREEWQLVAVKTERQPGMNIVELEHKVLSSLQHLPNVCRHIYYGYAGPPGLPGAPWREVR